ncbi:MAG: hypothetical protein LUI06_02265 [Ruminococcus sp.]|nr:hypothetical protein [Ruminococcus sp.]
MNRSELQKVFTVFERYDFFDEERSMNVERTVLREIFTKLNVESKEYLTSLHKDHVSLQRTSEKVREKYGNI